MILLFFLYSVNICNMTLLLFVERNILFFLPANVIIYFPFLAIRSNDSSIRITKAVRKRFQESLEERDVM